VKNSSENYYTGCINSAQSAHLNTCIMGWIYNLLQTHVGLILEIN